MTIKTSNAFPESRALHAAGAPRTFRRGGARSTLAPFIGRTAVLCLFALLLAAGSTGQQLPLPFERIAYELSMPSPQTHLFQVSITVETPVGDPLPYVDFQMPRWQPGRYSVSDFAKNVQEFSARADDRVLRFDKTDDQTWRVQTAGARTLTVSYKVYGNDLSGTYAQLDVTHANYNGGELFMYVVGHKQDPVSLRIIPAFNWRVINGATTQAGQTQFSFPNYELLIDHPTEIGPSWTVDQFVVDGKPYRVVVHSRGGEGGLRPVLMRGLERIVRANIAMWGQPDFDQYTFLIHYAADDRSGDGMEHLNSTQIVLAGLLSDPGSYERTLETASHEFFHVWNVKRLRPVEFGPWDWTRPANTRSLWIAEGLTEYYGYIMLRRAGLWEEGEFLREIAAVISHVEGEPGRRLMSPIDASLAAPFIDTNVHRQRTNLSNTSVTYYYSGALVGVVLDLLIRQRTNGARSLDDVLTRMYDEFYVNSPNATYYLKGRGYTVEDFVRALSDVAGTDMTDFYEKHIRGVEPLPYAEVFAGVGLNLVRTPSSFDYVAGITLDPADRDNLRLGALVSDSSAARSGLQQGDIILSMDGIPVDRGNWGEVLSRFRAGDRVPIVVRRFRREVTVNLQIGPIDTFSYRFEEMRNVSPEARALRAAWLAELTPD